MDHPDTLSNRIPYEPQAKQLSEGYKQRKIEGNDARDTDTRVMWQGTEHVSTKRDFSARKHSINRNHEPVSRAVNFSNIELTPCGSSTTFVPSQRALSVKSEQSSFISILLALKFGCDVMFLHAVSTSIFLSLFSVMGKVASLHMIMGPSAPAGALNTWLRSSFSSG